MADIFVSYTSNDRDWGLGRRLCMCRVYGRLVIEAEAVAQDVEPRRRLRLRAVTEARDWGPVSSR